MTERLYFNFHFTSILKESIRKTISLDNYSQYIEDLGAVFHIIIQLQ